MTIVARGPGLIACSFTDTKVIVSPNGRHRWEFSWRFGPLFVDRRGEPLKKQPEPHTARWAAFEDWFKEWRKTNHPARNHERCLWAHGRLENWAGYVVGIALGSLLWFFPVVGVVGFWLITAGILGAGLVQMVRGKT